MLQVQPFPRHEIISSDEIGKTKIYCRVLGITSYVLEKVWRCRFNEPVDTRPVAKCGCGESLLARTLAEHRYAERISL